MTAHLNASTPPDPRTHDVRTHDEAVGFVLRLARALHIHGYTSHGLEAVLMEMTAHLGLIGQFFTTPTQLSASFGEIEHQRTHLIRVEPGEVNLGKLLALDEVTECVLRRKMTPAEGSKAIDDILAAPPIYPSWLQTLAYGLLSAAVCRILGGGLSEMFASSLIGLVTGGLALAAERYLVVGRVFELLAAFMAALLVNVFSATGVIRVSTVVTILSGVIVLMPGLSLTLALAELSAKHLVSGTARLAGAFSVFLLITFGVAVGSQLALSLVGPSPAVLVRPPAGWTEWAAVAAAPLALTVLLRARPRDTWVIMLVTAIGFVGAVGGARLVGPQLGAGLGALAVAICANLYERWLNHPATVPLVPGVLLLVPGSMGFRSFAALLDSKVVVGVDTAFGVVMTAIALVAGLLLANTLVPPTRSRYAVGRNA
jgi:uncharacterized membrane protein YjjP (DUF1212 family)